MIAYRARAVLAASTFALFSVAAPATGQVVTEGTSGGLQGQDVSAGTCGQGTTDGSSITVSGCADAEARNGGVVDTRTKAKVNDRRGMQHSTASSRDDDERVRSRTHTIVRQGEVVRSRTSTMYKMRGERPVRETTSTRATPQSTTNKKNKPK